MPSGCFALREQRCLLPTVDRMLNGGRMQISDRVRVWAVLLLLAVSSAGAAVRSPEVVSSQQPSSVTQRPTSTPYSGDLSVFDYPDRDKKLQIDRVMDLLGISVGKNVADIGAGSGWFTVLAARRVGPTGTVLAEDINPLAVEYIGKRIAKEDLEN